MNHLYTKFLLSFVIATVVVATTYDVPALEEFGNETQLIAANMPPIQPGLTLPAAPAPMTIPAPEPTVAPMLPTMPIETHQAAPEMTVGMTPTEAPVVSAPVTAPAPSTPVITPPAQPDTPMVAKPVEPKEKPAHMPQSPVATTSEPTIEVTHHAPEVEKESDERIKFLIEQVAQIQEKVTALEARLRSTEQAAHKTDSQLTTLINELEAPAPQDDDEQFVGSAPSMEPTHHEKKGAELPLFDDEDEDEADAAGRKL